MGRPRLHDEPWKQTTIRLPESLYDAAAAEAARVGGSVSRVIERALRDLLLPAAAPADGGDPPWDWKASR